MADDRIEHDEAAAAAAEWERLERRYHLYRGQVEAEAGWITNRTNWLLNANAFMVTAMAIVSTADPMKRQSIGEAIWFCLPLLGLLVNGGAAVMIYDAAVVSRLRTAEYLGGRGTGQLPDLIGAPGPHRRGIRFPLVFAVGFGLMWVVLGLVGLDLALD